MFSLLYVYINYFLERMSGGLIACPSGLRLPQHTLAKIMYRFVYVWLFQASDANTQAALKAQLLTALSVAGAASASDSDEENNQQIINTFRDILKEFCAAAEGSDAIRLYQDLVEICAGIVQSKSTYTRSVAAAYLEIGFSILSLGLQKLKQSASYADPTLWGNWLSSVYLSEDYATTLAYVIQNLANPQGLTPEQIALRNTWVDQFLTALVEQDQRAKTNFLVDWLEKYLYSMCGLKGNLAVGAIFPRLFNALRAQQQDIAAWLNDTKFLVQITEKICPINDPEGYYIKAFEFLTALLTECSTQNINFNLDQSIPNGHNALAYLSDLYYATSGDENEDLLIPVLEKLIVTLLEAGAAESSAYDNRQYGPMFGEHVELGQGVRFAPSGDHELSEAEKTIVEGQSFIGDRALILFGVWIKRGNRIGVATRIGSYSQIGPTCTIGDSNVIGDEVSIGETVTTGNQVLIGSLVKIGRRGWIGSNTQIGSYIQIADDFNCGANVTLLGVDNVPEGQPIVFTQIGSRVKIQDGTQIGAFCNIADNVTIFYAAILDANVGIGEGSEISSSIKAPTRIGLQAQLSARIKISEGVFIDVQSQLYDDVVILEGVQIGKACLIDEGTQIGKNSHIGRLVGTFENVTIGEDCSIAPFAEVNNSLLPNEERENWRVLIGARSRLGSKVTISIQSPQTMQLIPIPFQNYIIRGWRTRRLAVPRVLSRRLVHPRSMSF